MQLSSVLLLIRYCTVLQRIHPFFSCLVWFCEEKNVYQVQHPYCAHWDVKNYIIFIFLNCKAHGVVFYTVFWRVGFRLMSVVVNEQNFLPAKNRISEF
jgi:hypothetical protein